MVKKKKRNLEYVRELYKDSFKFILKKEPNIKEIKYKIKRILSLSSYKKDAFLKLKKKNITKIR